MAKNGRFLKDREARDFRKNFHIIIEMVRKDIKKLYKGFSPMIVGSARRKMVIRFGESPCDTDYQISFSNVDISTVSASIKKDFYESLKSKLTGPYKEWTCEISTSVVTMMRVEKGVKVHSADFAIIAHTKGGEAYRSNGKTDGAYTWGPMGKVREAYKKWRKAKPNQINDIKTRYMELRQFRHDSINDDKNDESYISSFGLFLQAVNEKIKKTK